MDRNMATNSLSLAPRVQWTTGGAGGAGACPVVPGGRGSRLRHTTWELARRETRLNNDANRWWTNAFLAASISRITKLS